MSAFVPARITGTVDRAIKKEGRNNPETACRLEGEIPAYGEANPPDPEIDEPLAIDPRHQLLQFFAGNAGTIPINRWLCHD